MIVWLNQVGRELLPSFAVHTVEIFLFVCAIWMVDRVLRLDLETRYALWSLGLLKLWIPPFISLSVPTSVPLHNLKLPTLLITQAIPIDANPSASLSWLGLAVGVWICACAVLGLRVIGVNLALGRRLRLAETIVPDRAHSDAWPGLQLFESSTLTAPILIGFRRPRVYLPSGWQRWPARHLQAVLRHEQSHWHHRDVWVLTIQTASLVVFGLNPIIWVLHRKLNHLRELRADEAVLTDDPSMTPASYSTLLLQFVQSSRTRVSSAGSLAFAADPSDLSRRVDHILSREGIRMLRRRRSVSVILIFTALILPASVRGIGVGSSAPPPSPNSDDYEFFQLETKPTLSRGVKPVFPEEARKQKIGGKVFLRFRVNEEGIVDSVLVLKGEEILKQAAVEAIRQMKFTPGRVGGNPVNTWMSQVIRFDLEDGASKPAKSKSTISLWVKGRDEILFDFSETIPASNLRSVLERKQDGRTQIEIRFDRDVKQKVIGRVIQATRIQGVEVVIKQ